MAKTRKTRAAAFVCAAVLAVYSMPMQVFAADAQRLFDVTNVKAHISFWGGTHYVTYTINGVDYDSRTAGSQINLMAFRNMDEEGKKTVSEHYYPGTDRDEQFGAQGVREICDYVNNGYGYTHAWKVMHDRAQNYCKDLIPYFGGVSAEDDPDRYYGMELEKLNTFTGDAKKFWDDPTYNQAPEAQAYREKFAMMNGLMETGKAAYDNCVKHNEFAREAALKASSAWLIKFIVENTIVPGLMAKPSATAAGVDSAMNTVYDQVLGMISEITGAENVSVTAEGNLVNLTIGKMGGQNVSLKDGAAMVTYMRDLADKNYRLAKYSHEKAVEFHDQLENEASEIIRKVDERLKKQQEKEQAAETKQQENNKKADTPEVKPNTTRYSGIQMPSSGDEDYAKKEEEYKNKLIAAAKALDEEVNSLYSQMLSEAESVTKSAGFYIASDGETYEDHVDFLNSVFYINYYKNSSVYYGIGSEAEYKKRPKLYDEEVEFLNNSISKMNTLESSLGGVTDRYSVLYKELYARRLALYDKGAYNYYILKYENWNNVTGLFGSINYIIFKAAYEGPGIERTAEDLPETHKKNMGEYENYKAQLQQKLNDYLTAQANFNLAYAKYADVAKEQLDLARTGLPDYVYTQTCQPRGYNLLAADGSNALLTAKIEAASDKHKFFKDESLKLEECMEKYKLYDKQKEVLKNYVKYYLRELQSIDHGGGELYYSNGLLSAEEFEKYGIDPKEFVQVKEFENEYKNIGKVNPITVEERGDILMCELLYRDFTGTGVYHNQFLSLYNEMVAKAPYYKQKIRSGEISAGSFGYYYASELLTPYQVLTGRATTPLTYSGAYTDIGESNEKSFSDMLYGSDGILTEITNVENDALYTPAEGLTAKNGKDGVELEAGGTSRLSVAVRPENATEKGVRWYSGDDSIAVVDQNGNVTGKSSGTTTVYAISKDAPIEESTDENGDKHYICPDEFIVSFTVTVTGELPPNEFVYGDADGDNVLTASDAALVLQKTLTPHIDLPLKNITDDWLEYVDVDGDKVITASDAVMILQKTLTPSAGFPVG